MTITPDPFWAQIEAQLDAIGTAKPDTFSAVAKILHPVNDRGQVYGTPPDATPWVSRIDATDRRAEPDAFPESILTHGVDYAPNSAFFAGSGGDRSLWGALHKAGWARIWSEASYYWVAQHPVTSELLTYVEGDVLRGDAR